MYLQKQIRLSYAALYLRHAQTICLAEDIQIYKTVTTACFGGPVRMIHLYNMRIADIAGDEDNMLQHSDWQMGANCVHLPASRITVPTPA